LLQLKNTARHLLKRGRSRPQLIQALKICVGDKGRNTWLRSAHSHEQRAGSFRRKGHGFTALLHKGTNTTSPGAGAAGCRCRRVPVPQGASAAGCPPCPSAAAGKRTPSALPDLATDASLALKSSLHNVQNPFVRNSVPGLGSGLSRTNTVRWREQLFFPWKIKRKSRACF